MVQDVCLACLDPSVVFGELASQTHAVILTSGTLSPMGSFSSELGVEFKLILEAKHVVDMTKQVIMQELARCPYFPHY